MTGDPVSSQPLLIRAIVAAIVGAVVGAAAFAGAYVSRPGFVATLDGTPAPAVARGLHPSEFEAGGALSYAWTEGRVTLVFEGLDRSRPWTLILRARAGQDVAVHVIGADFTLLRC